MCELRRNVTIRYVAKIDVGKGEVGHLKFVGPSKFGNLKEERDIQQEDGRWYKALHTIEDHLRL